MVINRSKANFSEFRKTAAVGSALLIAISGTAFADKTEGTAVRSRTAAHAGTAAQPETCGDIPQCAQMIASHLSAALAAEGDAQRFEEQYDSEEGSKYGPRETYSRCTSGPMMDEWGMIHLQGYTDCVTFQARDRAPLIAFRNTALREREAVQDLVAQLRRLQLGSIRHPFGDPRNPPYQRDWRILEIGDGWREPDQTDGTPGIIWGETVMRNDGNAIHCSRVGRDGVCWMVYSSERIAQQGGASSLRPGQLGAVEYCRSLGVGAELPRRNDFERLSYDLGRRYFYSEQTGSRYFMPHIVPGLENNFRLWARPAIPDRGTATEPQAFETTGSRRFSTSSGDPGSLAEVRCILRR